MSSSEVRAGAARAEILATPVSISRAQRPFGSLTVAEVALRAAELKSVVGFGPTIRVAPVARAWRELELVMGRQAAETVAELGDEVLREIAPKLWVTPPGGSLL